MSFSKKWSFLLGMFLLTAVLAQATGYGAYELQRAKTTMNQGDYRYALRMFRDITMNYQFSDSVKREAFYYVGFCQVKTNDPWGAISSYREFLDRYEYSSNSQLVPDALYVLGRTYEDVRQPRDAERCYRRCQDNFPYSEFARKSSERLRVLGYSTGGHGGNSGGNHGGYDQHSGISREVRDVIDLARMTNNSFEADQMLLRGGRHARNGADFIALSKAIRNDFTRGQLFDVAKNSREFAYIPVFMIVQLAKTSSNSFQRDQLLMAAAQKVARTASDFRDLAEATDNSFTRRQILDLAKSHIGGPRFNIDGIAASVDTSATAPRGSANARSAGPKAQAKPRPAMLSASDPFVDFTLDADRIERVNRFIEAVQKKSGMEAAHKALAKEDLELETVQESVKTFEQIRSFNKVHGNSR